MQFLAMFGIWRQCRQSGVAWAGVVKWVTGWLLKPEQQELKICPIFNIRVAKPNLLPSPRVLVGHGTCCHIQRTTSGHQRFCGEWIFKVLYRDFGDCCNPSYDSCLTENHDESSIQYTQLQYPVLYPIFKIQSNDSRAPRLVDIRETWILHHLDVNLASNWWIARDHGEFP